jgi:hypothetical protein
METPKFDPCRSETVEPIDTKVCRIDYVAEISEFADFDMEKGQ